MKTLLTLFLSFSLTLGFTQTTHKAVYTEIYKKQHSTGKWLLLDKNETTITIVSDSESIMIQAKSPTFFKLFPGSEEDIITESFVGKKYIGIELKRDVKCDIHILKHLETNYLLLSIFYDDYNLRYFIEPQKNIKNGM